jgi:hypothetical protein
MLHIKYPHARINHITSRPTFQPSEAQKEADLATLMAEVPRVFDGVCRVMAGPPCHFVLKEGAVPVKIRGSRPFGTTPSTFSRRTGGPTQTRNNPESIAGRSYAWIHKVVVVPKKQGGIRFYPDYRPINKFLIGSKFDNPTPFQSVRSIPPKE